MQLQAKLTSLRGLVRRKCLLEGRERIQVTMHIHSPQVDLVAFQFDRAARHIPGAHGARATERLPYTPAGGARSASVVGRRSLRWREPNAEAVRRRALLLAADQCTQWSSSMRLQGMG